MIEYVCTLSKDSPLQISGLVAKTHCSSLKQGTDSFTSPHFFVVYFRDMSVFI